MKYNDLPNTLDEDGEPYFELDNLVAVQQLNDPVTSRQGRPRLPYFPQLRLMPPRYSAAGIHPISLSHYHLHPHYPEVSQVLEMTALWEDERARRNVLSTAVKKREVLCKEKYKSRLSSWWFTFDDPADDCSRCADRGIRCTMVNFVHVKTENGTPPGLQPGKCVECLRTHKACGITKLVLDYDETATYEKNWRAREDPYAVQHATTGRDDIGSSCRESTPVESEDELSDWSETIESDDEVETSRRDRYHREHRMQEYAQRSTSTARRNSSASEAMNHRSPHQANSEDGQEISDGDHDPEASAPFGETPPPTDAHVPEEPPHDDELPFADGYNTDHEFAFQADEGGNDDPGIQWMQFDEPLGGPHDEPHDASTQTPPAVGRGHADLIDGTTGSRTTQTAIGRVGDHAEKDIVNELRAQLMEKDRLIDQAERQRDNFTAERDEWKLERARWNEEKGRLGEQAATAALLSETISNVTGLAKTGLALLEDTSPTGPNLPTRQRESSVERGESPDQELDMATTDNLVRLVGRLLEVAQHGANASSKLDELQAESRTLILERDTCTATLKGMTDQLRDTKAESADKLRDERSRNDELQGKLDAARKSYAAAKQQSSTLEDQLSSAQQKVDEGEEKRKSLEARLTASNKLHNAASRETAATRTRFEADLKVSESKIGKLEIELREARSAKAGLEKSLAERQTKIAQLEVDSSQVAKKQYETIESLRSAAEQAEGAHEGAKAEWQKVQQRYAEVLERKKDSAIRQQAEIDGLQKHKGKQEEQIQALQSTVHAARSATEKAQSATQKAEYDLGQANGQLRRLQSTCDLLETQRRRSDKRYRRADEILGEVRSVVVRLGPSEQRRFASIGLFDTEDESIGEGGGPAIYDEMEDESYNDRESNVYGGMDDGYVRDDGREWSD